MRGIELVALAAVAWAAPARAQVDAPADILAFIDREVSCHSLRDPAACASLAVEQQGLRARHGADPRLVALIDGDWVLVVERVPVPPGVLLLPNDDDPDPPP